MMDELQSRFYFTDSDLQANRAGHVTETQRQQLADDAKGFWQAAGLTVMVAIIGTVFGSIGVWISADPIYHNVMWGAVFVIIAFGTLAAIVMIYQHKCRLKADADNGHVIAVQGMLNIVEPVTGSIGRVRVRKRTFALATEEQVELVRRLVPTDIIVYCTPHSNRPLSLELPERDS